MATIHHAEMCEIDGVLYCNDGDWVVSLTALVEHADDRLAIADGSAQRALVASAARRGRRRLRDPGRPAVRQRRPPACPPCPPCPPCPA